MGFAVISHLLNRTALVTRNAAPTSDGRGGWRPNPQTVYSALPCRLAPLSASDQLLGLQRDAKATHALFAEMGVDVQLQDVVTIGDRAFRVQASQPPSLDYFSKWQLEEIQRA